MHEKTKAEKLREPTPSLMSGLESYHLLSKTSRNFGCVTWCEEMEEARGCWDPAPKGEVSPAWRNPTEEGVTLLNRTVPRGKDPVNWLTWARP